MNMLSKIINIKNPSGLHTRLTASFVDKASKFEADIKIQKGEIYCNAKEFLKTLKMGIIQGSTISLWCDGSDEHEAMRVLSDYLERLEEQEIPMLSTEEAILALKMGKN